LEDAQPGRRRRGQKQGGDAAVAGQLEGGAAAAAATPELPEIVQTLSNRSVVSRWGFIVLL